ncbi:MAG: alpha-ketoacid dehydrogenase subunit beta, partial [Gammaproteobacteria bacterium]|nr:alpha-ketoacid dehydrogenase subunit beta [Gammaproteobacteria bacterium]
EPKRIYRAVSQPVEDDGVALPLDTCFTLREGQDVTLVAWGAMIPEVLKAAAQLSEEGVEAEVIDVATLSPLDMDTILCSVAKTGRCVIVHEACRHVGVGAEIAAGLAEQALYDLKAPVVRVTGYDTVMPYLRNEGYFLPDVPRILEGVRQVMAVG